MTKGLCTVSRLRKHDYSVTVALAPTALLRAKFRNRARRTYAPESSVNGAPGKFDLSATISPAASLLVDRLCLFSLSELTAWLSTQLHPASATIWAID